MTIATTAEEERALKSKALDELKLHSQQLKQAKAAYEASLWKAKHLGVANTIIARAVGLSEAAVRMYFKRNDR